MRSIERLQSMLQPCNAPSPPLLEKAHSFCGGAESHDARVSLVAITRDEASFFEGGDKTRHGGRSYLFGGGEFPKGERPPEDDNGERRKARSAQSTLLIFGAKPAEEMNGDTVEAVSGAGG